ncbi:MAG: phage capsid protein, partial [Rhodopila sp.]
MPDTIEPGSDTVRDEVVRSAVAALDFVAPALSAGVDLLLPRLHAAIPTPELARMSPEALAASTASLWSLAAQRGAGEALVRVTPRGAGGIAEIVTDDMPYLVDSALAVLSRAGRVIHRVLHPVLTLRRDAAGTLLDVVSAATPGAKRESLMRIEFGATGRAAAATSDTVEAALLRALADVRIVNAEQAAMRDLLSIAKQEIAGSPTPEAKPAQRFLDWLLDDNLLLLGHRHVAVHADGDLQVTQAESLGLLRDPAVTAFDTLRDMAAIPPGVRAAMLRPEPLVVAKANLRSTVHRPQHCDALITRSFDPDGQVLGLRVFLGLFAGPAYTRNPRSIPMFAEKVNAMLAAAGLDLGSHDGRALRDILDTWPRDELFQAPQDAILAGARRALDLQLRPRTALVLRHDPFERFVSAIVWLPRDVYNSQLRERVGGMLARAFGGSLATYYTAVGDEPLARINYILATTPGGIPAVDADALEQAVVQTARDFRDRLADALEEAHGEGVAARLIARWGDAFPGAYREGCTSAQGVADLALAEQAMADGRAAV